MMNLLLILLGIVLITLGLWLLAQFLVSFKEQNDRLAKLVNNENYEHIETLRLEVDELNYSYYEILDDLEQRLAVIEEAREHPGPHTQNLSSEPIDEDEILPPTSGDLQDQVIGLIEQGLKDYEIARLLNLGSGQVGLIRSLYRQKK